MKLFSSTQIKEIDEYSIVHEPITSVALMERVAEILAHAILDIYPHVNRFLVFCGPGNNGGDGLAVARLLALQGKCLDIVLLYDQEKFSTDTLINYKRLKKTSCVTLHRIDKLEDLPELGPQDVVIDAMFGTGLSRPLNGWPLEVVTYINSCQAEVVSIDMPSGLPGEDCSGFPSDGIVCATNTLTLQFPKLSFFFPENEKYVGLFQVLPIGLHPQALTTIPTPYQFITASNVKPLLPKRATFGHKGTFGHLLLIAGSKGMMGASVLSARAACRAGVGLVTSHVPSGQGQIVQIAVPEVLVVEDMDTVCFSSISNIKTYSAIAVGPGISKHQKARVALRQLLKEVESPLLLDADALNIIAEERDMLDMLPPNTILTPHPKELSRLVGDWSNSFQRLELQQAFALKYQVVLLCKGAFTTIALPNGDLLFNSTGNSGMATGGTGDVLSGIIGGLLAQGLTSVDAAILGVYLHGLAGDISAGEIGQQALTASDLVNNLGKAWLSILK
ncbi:NAD(P)H-hydrate dehydratase [Williamwhitmania taraxaci]|nr:NAD(P)H-hydrate dehydratase [Williamwhitmania taraxaci]